MAYVSGLPSYVNNADGYQLKGAVDTRQTRMQQFRNGAGPEKQPEPRPPQSADHDKIARGAGGDRRKVCQRILHHPVLVELRSGINRRRRNLREGDIVEHISLEV